VDHLLSLKRSERGRAVHAAIVASIPERANAGASEPPLPQRIDEMVDYLDRVGPLDRTLDPEATQFLEEAWPGGEWRVGDMLAALGYARLRPR